MKNRIQPGHTMTVTAPANVKSGEFVVVGDLFGVANADALSGTPVEVDCGGVFTLPKAAAQAWTECVGLYWDATAKAMTTNSNSGANKRVGVAALAAVSAAVLGTVRLNASF